MDNSTNFLIAFDFVKSLFIKVFSTLDKIKIFGSFSILDFNIALLLLGAILPVVIVTVRNWSSSAHNEQATIKKHRDEYNTKLNNNR